MSLHKDAGSSASTAVLMQAIKPEEITQSLPIPEHKMGWIVGKKGSYITQLCRKSGAHITISESTSREYGIIWKYIQITGSGRAVDRAKKLIHIRLERLESTVSAGVNSKDEDYPPPTLEEDLES